jgi:hypothetical protein
MLIAIYAVSHFISMPSAIVPIVVMLSVVAPSGTLLSRWRIKVRQFWGKTLMQNIYYVWQTDFETCHPLKTFKPPPGLIRPLRSIPAESPGANPKTNPRASLEANPGA